LSIWSKDYLILLVINAVSALGHQILTPILPLYASGMGAVESQLGYLAAAASFAALLIRPVAGVIADNSERKRVMFIVQIAVAAVIFTMSLSTNIYLLIGLRMCQGFLHGITTTLTMVSVVQTLPAEKMGQGMGVYGVSTIGNQAIAPALGLFFIDTFGYHSVFYATTSLIALSAMLTLGLKKQAESVKSGEKKSKFSFQNAFAKESIGIAAVGCIFMSGHTAVGNFLVVFARERGIQEVGFYFTIHICVLIGTRLFSSRWIDELPYQRILYPCAALCVTGLWLISMARSFAYLAVAGVIMGLGYGISTPTIQTAVVRQVEPERQGAASATYFVGTDLSVVLGSVMMGNVAERFDYDMGFRALCGPLLATVPFMMYLTRKKKSAR
jgi:predicted MFS family arabinose efflux permease